MATEAGVAALAAEGTSSGIGAISAAGAGIKAFVLSNPASLAAVAGIAVGVLGYHFLFDHGEHLVADGEQEGGGADVDAAEPAAP
ncbi:MAG: hypothetical protein WBM40_20510 [Thiohalocapsa sp.]